MEFWLFWSTASVRDSCSHFVMTKTVKIHATSYKLRWSKRYHKPRKSNGKPVVNLHIEMSWECEYFRHDLSPYLKHNARKHSSRMCTTHLQTVDASMVTTRCSSGERSPNEQVWTSLQWWPPDVTNGGPGLMSFGGQVWCSGEGNGGGGLDSEVQYIMGNAHMGDPQWTDRCLWEHCLSPTSLVCGNIMI